MEFDHFTLVSLLSPEVEPRLTEVERDRLQDLHLSNLADLHDAGVLLAAGPTVGPPNRTVRGYAILNVDPGAALTLMGEDAAVRAGVFELGAIVWMMPAGAMTFTPTVFPRSVAEAAS